MSRIPAATIWLDDFRVTYLNVLYVVDDRLDILLFEKSVPRVVCLDIRCL
jgi:hypothetical protein